VTVVGVVRPAALALSASVLLAPVFYPWYALPALALLAVSVTDVRSRARLAAVCAGLVFLTLPDGYGIAVASKLPGSLLDVALVVTAVGWWLRRRRPTYRWIRLFLTGSRP
jgi:hypothetical protein